MTNLTIWLTPIWLLAVGVTMGAVVLVAAWLLCLGVNRRLASTIRETIAEGILLQISYTVIASVVLAVVAAPIMPVDRLITSLKRLPHVGTIEKEVTVPASTPDHLLEISFRADELQSYFITTSEDIAINTETAKGFVDPLLTVDGGSTGEPSYEWTPGSTAERVFDQDVQSLLISNESDLPTTVTVRVVTDVEMPEVHYLPITAAGVVGLFLLYLLVRWLAPRVSVLATATAKEAVSQPVFLLLMIVGVAALVAYIYIPYNTFGEDVKMLKSTGMTTIKVLAIVMALWTASVSVAEEIEGRTALTVLSKPISRRQFILGKFLGIVWPIVLMFVLLGIVFLISVSYKVVYDARESAKTSPEWQLCFEELIRIVPGLLLAFMEAVVLAAISVAVSTRLSMLPNLVICGSIYVLGHLGPLIVNSAAGKIVFVRFIGRLISVVFPVLDHYEIEGAIAGSASVPPSYLLNAALYSLLYCAAAMLLALIFFEDRDLA